MVARHTSSGIFLLIMILSSVASDLVGGTATIIGYVLLLLSGVSGWSAAAQLLPRIRHFQLVMICILLFAGLVLLLFSWSRDGQIPWHRILTINTGLLTMIVSVGFLKLVVVRGFANDGLLPHGMKAFRETMLTVAVFGSFINISAPVLVADRLSLNQPLTLFSCSLLTRTFSGCSAWSPFFGGMAVVLTYVEGMQLFLVMLMAFPFSLIGLVVIYTLAVNFHAEEVSAYRGYPMQFSSLWIPAALAILVIGMSVLLPDLSILTIIALCAIILTVTTLVYLDGFRIAHGQLQEFVVEGLPRTANELVLFLAAGVLAVGLERLIMQGQLQLPFSDFSQWTASLLLATMVIISILGIHPVVQIAGITPLLLSINADPQLLALTYMLAWSLGTCASPFSGTHLVMQGRFGIPSWQGAMFNWPFVIIMYFVAISIIHVSIFFL